VRFVTSEFRGLYSRATQRVWLMVVRSVLRYLAEEGLITAGWDAALPSIANPRHAQLPRGLTEDQVRALWRASQGKGWRALRSRALLLLFLRLGLRTEEVAALLPGDIEPQRKSFLFRIQGAAGEQASEFLGHIVGDQASRCQVGGNRREDSAQRGDRLPSDANTRRPALMVVGVEVLRGGSHILHGGARRNVGI